jgi:hypothetical protein
MTDFQKMNKTKKKIILSAIELFNEAGLMNVRNQDIAKKASISLSNFNYHFSTKQDLVFAVFTYIGEILETEVYGTNSLIYERNGLEMMVKYFDFVRKYKFFFLDTYNIVKTYPVLRTEMNKRAHESMQITKNLNYMAVGMGHMKPEPKDMPGLYDNLAEQIWVNHHFLYSQYYIRGYEDITIKQGIESIFALNYPYLTEEGIKTYREYLESISK